MKNQYLNLRVPAIRPGVVLLLLTVFFFSITGCSTFSALKKTTKKITRDIIGSREDLKKKIAIVSFENNTFLAGKDLQEAVQKNLVETITQGCPDALLVKTGDAGFPDSLMNPPRLASGQVNNFALAKIGRESGLYAIVTGSLIGIKENEKEKGILWFKNPHHFVQVQIDAEMYDPETGTKILDDRHVLEIKINESEFEAIKAKKTASSLKYALSLAANAIGKKICDAVNVRPWKGYIVSVAEDRIILSSGKKAGLIPGDKFEVFDSGNVIEGMGGRQFFLPGVNKTGEIKITAVYPDRAEAVLLSGKRIQEGNLVKYKN